MEHLHRSSIFRIELGLGPSLKFWVQNVLRKLSFPALLVYELLAFLKNKCIYDAIAEA